MKFTKANLKGLGCLTLFFLPFVIVGLYTAFLSFKSIYNCQSSQSWTKKTAILKDLKFKSSTDNDGMNSSEIVVKYVYTFDNVVYEGNRIGFGYGMNNIDSHSELFDKLRTAKKIIVYINPNDPKESVMTQGWNNSIVGLLIFAIMWNLFISLFLTPIFFNNKVLPENVIFNVTNPSND